MAKTRRRYVGRTAVVGAAEGQADAPATNAEQDGVRDVVDGRWRADWQRRFAGSGPYEEYAEAYDHGYVLASHEDWSEKQWEDIEPHARDTWERHRPGTWDRFAAAVRRGWEWLTVPEDDQKSPMQEP